MLDKYRRVFPSIVRQDAQMPAIPRLLGRSSLPDIYPGLVPPDPFLPFFNVWILTFIRTVTGQRSVGIIFPELRDWTPSRQCKTKRGKAFASACHFLFLYKKKVWYREPSWLSCPSHLEQVPVREPGGHPPSSLDMKTWSGFISERRNEVCCPPLYSFYSFFFL